MSLLLDTDICVAALRGDPAVLEKLLSTARSAVAISVVTEAELRTGVAKSRRVAHNELRLDNFLRPMAVLDFQSSDAVVYSRVRARLEAEGRKIGPMDTLIAAHAVSRARALVTRNTREFGRVEGLRLVSWIG